MAQVLRCACLNQRGVLAMDAVFLLLVAVGLVAYLLYALLKAEEF